MSRFIIHGGKPLSGELTAGGNKNAVLPIIAATLLTDEEVVLENVPHIRDVISMLEIVEHLGAEVDHDGHRVRSAPPTCGRPRSPGSCASRRAPPSSSWPRCWRAAGEPRSAHRAAT